MAVELERLVRDFASALKAADARKPRAINARSKKPFQPGIGPHSEADAVGLVVAELEKVPGDDYGARIARAVPYPETPKQKCDLLASTMMNGHWLPPSRRSRRLPPRKCAWDQGPVVPATALRFSRFFGTSPAFWVNLQLRWDLYHAQQSEADELRKIRRMRAAG